MVVSILWQRHLPVFRIFQAFLTYPLNQLVSSSSFSCAHSGCSFLIFLMRNFNFPSSSIFYLLFSHFSPNDSTFRPFLSFPFPNGSFPNTLRHAPIAWCTSSSKVWILYFFERSLLFILFSLSLSLDYKLFEDINMLLLLFFILFWLPSAHTMFGSY